MKSIVGSFKVMAFTYQKKLLIIFCLFFYQCEEETEKAQEQANTAIEENTKNETEKFSKIFSYAVNTYEELPYVT